MRCTGHCCRQFHLPYSPEDLHAKRFEINDGVMIADMVTLVKAFSNFSVDFGYKTVQMMNGELFHVKTGYDSYSIEGNPVTKEYFESYVRKYYLQEKLDLWAEALK